MDQLRLDDPLGLLPYEDREQIDDSHLTGMHYTLIFVDRAGRLHGPDYESVLQAALPQAGIPPWVAKGDPLRMHTWSLLSAGLGGPNTLLLNSELLPEEPAARKAAVGWIYLQLCAAQEAKDRGRAASR